MGKATARPLLLGATLLAASGALWLATITVRPERSEDRQTSWNRSGIAVDEARLPATAATPPPQPTEDSALESLPSATRTELAITSQPLHAALVDRNGNPHAGTLHPTLDLTERPKLELKVTLPTENRDWALVDEDTGALCQAADARAGRARVIVFADDGRRWLSRDVLPIPAHGVVTWTPSLAPMRITLRVRAPNGAPIAHTAVSRVRADDRTDGWHGHPLGLTDAVGEIELSGDVNPFKLRVDGVASLVGPFTPDPRREVQVIEVEVPAR